MLVFRGTGWNREDSESNTKLLKFVWICLLYILGSLQIVLPGIAGSMPCRDFGFPQFERFSSFKRWLDKPHSVGSEDAEIWIPDPRDRLATCRQSQFLGGWILCSSISFKPDLQPIQAQRTWIFRHKPGHQVLCRWLQYAMTINDQNFSASQWSKPCKEEPQQDIIITCEPDNFIHKSWTQQSQCHAQGAIGTKCLGTEMKFNFDGDPLQWSRRILRVNSHIFDLWNR